MEWLGGLIGAGANLLNGMFGRQQTADINAQNLAESRYQATHSIQEKVDDAKAAGINPLAALGVSSVNPAVAVGNTDSGIAAAGQDIARAASAANKDNKEQLLKEKLLEAQIANTNSDTVKNTAAASSLALRAQPGTPPGVRVPLPTAAPHTRDTLPLYQDFRDRGGGRVTLLSKEASEAVQNASSLPMAVPLGAGLVGENIPNAANVMPWPSIRGDAWRGQDNSQYVPF